MTCMRFMLWLVFFLRKGGKESLVASLLEQACEDPAIPVIGYLGGYVRQAVVTVDAQGQKRECLLCHACDFVASERALDSLLDQVPEETADSLERATLLFRDRGLDCIGWYRSVPAHHASEPTLSDVQRQCFLQYQCPWTIAVLVTPPAPSSGGASFLGDTPPEFAVFRMSSALSAGRRASLGSGRDRLLDTFAVVHGNAANTLQHVLVNTLAESKKSYALHLADNEGRTASCVIADSEYDSFLTDFWKCSVTELSKSIERDFSTLAMHKLHLKRRIAERIQSLALMRADCRVKLEDMDENMQHGQATSAASIAEHKHAIHKLLSVLAPSDAPNKTARFPAPPNADSLPHQWFTRVGAPLVNWNT
ncbi:hypothetical protein THASP1DRAFT_33462, partial [Thamnocephalis sphaerospora]